MESLKQLLKPLKNHRKSSSYCFDKRLLLVIKRTCHAHIAIASIPLSYLPQVCVCVLLSCLSWRALFNLPATRRMRDGNLLAPLLRHLPRWLLELLEQFSDLRFQLSDSAFVYFIFYA